jgi:hypothetical protein
MASKSKKRKRLYAFLAIILIGGIAIVAAFMVLQPQAGVSGPAETTTINLISYTDGEDVSNFIEVSVWTPDPDADFEDPEDDIKNGNYEEDIKATDAKDIEINLENYDPGVWIEVDPEGDSVFESTWHFLSGGNNYNYKIYLTHLSSDVHLSTSSRSGSEGWDLDTDGNYSLVMDFPGYTTSNEHAGEDGGDGDDGWEIDDDDLEDYDTDDYEYLYNERNWRAQRATFDLEATTNYNYESTLERNTEFYAIKYEFNTTISSTDGAATQVNFTYNDNNDLLADTHTTGQYVYVIMQSPVLAMDNFDFEVQLAVNITCSNIYSGRATINDGSINGLSFSAYSSSISA